MESYDYIILGCGSFGSQVIMDLIQAGKRVIAVDKNPEKVEVLKDQEIEAVIGDIEKDETLKKLNISDAEAVLVLTANDQTNLNVVRKIRSLAPEVLIVTRASSFKAREELESSGADIVITPYDAMKTSLLNQLKRAENLRKLKRLKNVLKDCKRLAIFTHDNPDPDAISSAMALREIAKHFGVAADILYYGEIAHQQNRAMVNLLNVEMLKASEVDLSIYDKFALVDSSGIGVNNSIPEDITLSIIIDHHPAESVEAEYYDLRNDVGATATILTQYIQDLKIVPTRMLATALFFGIQTETEEFKKNTRTADFLAAAFLYPFVDNELIEKMEGPALSTETLDVIGTAIKNREIFSSFLISFAGFINDRDTLPQAADFLLKLEGISTVLVFGIMKDAVYISARNRDVRINIGEVPKKAFGDVGSAGGHAHAAGGKIPLGIFGDVTDKQTLAKLVTEAIKRRFLTAVGIESE